MSSLLSTPETTLRREGGELLSHCSDGHGGGLAFVELGRLGQEDGRLALPPVHDEQIGERDERLGVFAEAVGWGGDVERLAGEQFGLRAVTAAGEDRGADGA